MLGTSAAVDRGGEQGGSGQSVKSVFVRIANEGDASDGPRRIQELVTGILKRKSVKEAEELIDIALEETPRTALYGRASLDVLLRNAYLLEDKQVISELAKRIISSVASRVTSFEDQDRMARELVAWCLSEENRYREAIQWVGTPNYEGAVAKLPKPADRAEKLIFVAELLQRACEYAAAEKMCHKAQPHVDATTGDDQREARVKHTKVFAAALTALAKFPHACHRHFALATNPDLDSYSQMHHLDEAVRCALLSPAGAVRDRAAARLIKDGRIEKCVQYELLTKVIRRRVVPRPEFLPLNEGLPESLLSAAAKDGAGMTPAEVASIEHNIQAVAALYSSISLERLGEIMGLQPDAVARVTAKMIMQERIKGSIDQHSGILHFNLNSAEESSEQLLRWDKSLARGLGALMEAAGSPAVLKLRQQRVIK
eukprot:GHVU01017887.1.p1 GENE.GHVU01017887.1~~GHVU01017887.1.p1  ORF type:complete len:428 (-),score=71.06 GHVU01017887.1:509-1792(-)